MKNIEKKWTLFLIATFVTIFGITDTLVKETHAISEEELKEIYNNIKFDNCTLSDYIIDEDNNYIYVGTSNILKVNDCIDCSSEEVDIVVNKEKSILQISYSDIVIRELDLFNIGFGDYKIKDSVIYITDNVSYDKFVSAIVKSDKLSYKIYKDYKEITDGLILNDMILEVYYNDKLLDKFDIVISNEDNVIKDYNSDGVIDLKDLVEKEY